MNDTTEDQDESEESRQYDLSKVHDQVEMFRDGLSNGDISELVASRVAELAKKHKVNKYTVLLLFDPKNSISSYHSNRIYQALSEPENKEDILMLIESEGGEIEPAYLISKTCKRLAKEKFVVTVPRRAKSAATLISLGAAEVHMGLLSELGPIDPQFGGFPALGLANAVEKIAEMTEKYPSASDMLAKYLIEKVNIRDIGYFQRINESAVQYATRLLDGKELPEEKSCEELADHFTNHYKDHGFVIDADEAAGLLGKNVVKEKSAEYQFGNAVYDFLHFIGILFSVFRNKKMRYVGSIERGLDLDDEK